MMFCLDSFNLQLWLLHCGLKSIGFSNFLDFCDAQKNYCEGACGLVVL
jgi:hypothetical protein